MNKTRRVEIRRLVRHPKYGKYVRQRTVCYAHDEGNVAVIGDKVEIVESAPKSKLKRWTLTRVIQKITVGDAVASQADADSDQHTDSPTAAE
jgi:small subunit ribosomal protein S17